MSVEALQNGLFLPMLATLAINLYLVVISTYNAIRSSLDTPDSRVIILGKALKQADRLVVPKGAGAVIIQLSPYSETYLGLMATLIFIAEFFRVSTIKQYLAACTEKQPHQEWLG